MVRSFVMAAGLSLVLAAQGLAATVFSDDFLSDKTATSVTKLANFTVAGNVDVVGPTNAFGITTATPDGKVVDLDGKNGAGKLTSKQRFSFKAGDTIRLDMLVGGSQRVVGKTDGFFADFTFDDAVDVLNWSGSGYFASLGGDDLLSVVGVGVGINLASKSKFLMTSMSFLAGNSGSMTFSIGTTSKDRIGPLLASVSLDITPAAVPLPAAGTILLMGLGLLAALRRKRLAA